MFLKQIFHTEQVIQHETLDLKDEKQFIREIKQLKTLRDQLASNMGTKEEVRQALDQKDQNEERMKVRGYLFLLFCYSTLFNNFQKCVGFTPSI